nr:peroxisome proliferator-activated receptor gamma coactivator-related protein like [Tanacetum cinerariifolium]
MEYQQKSATDVEMGELKKKLVVIDKQIENGGISVDVHNSRKDVLKRIQDINSLDFQLSLPRIRWRIWRDQYLKMRFETRFGIVEKINHRVPMGSRLNFFGVIRDSLEMIYAKWWNAFVKDRQILDGTFIINEIISWCKQKKKQDMLFKGDFAKAYDSIRWNFLDDVLQAFGSGDWNMANINNIVHVLHVFYLASGLKININKSDLMGIRVANADVTEAAKVWRFVSKDDSMWYKVISAIHGPSLQSFSLSILNGSSWIEIIQELNSLKSKEKFPRIYALENCKDVSVAVKFSSVGGIQNYRREPRGGVEKQQFTEMNLTMNQICLAATDDRWSWDLNGEGSFVVKDLRNLIDDFMLPKEENVTRWIKYIHIKVNIFAWKVWLNRLPSRINLSRRGILLDSLDCPVCLDAPEDLYHCIFRCEVANEEEGEEVVRCRVNFLRRAMLFIRNRRQANRPTKTPIYRDRYGAHDHLVAASFSENLMYDEYKFRKTFQMAHPLFNWIVNEVTNNSSFFRDNIDYTRKEGISPLLECTSAIRQLAYGINADFLDEYLQMSERSSQKHGFPGMLESLDCTDWEWFGCLYAFKGQYVRHDHGLNPFILLEAIASRAPEIPFVANGVIYPWGYYLVDGIYPELATLVKKIPEPADDDNKRILYKLKQESARKDVERAFGVLKKKWAILANPARALKRNNNEYDWPKHSHPMAIGTSPVILFLLLLTTPTSPLPIPTPTTFQSLFSLSHSLLTRVSNLRASRDDISGSIRAKSIADNINKHTSGFGFYKLIWSVGWDYVTNYAWRDTAAVGFDMFGVVSDINQLVSSLTELTQLGSDVQKVQWVARNYGNLLKVVKSLFNRLLKVFTRSGPLKDAVEILRTEIVDGGLLQDCLELGSSDLKGVIQILKDVAVQYSSTSHKNEL